MFHATFPRERKKKLARQLISGVEKGQMRTKQRFCSFLPENTRGLKKDFECLKEKEEPTSFGYKYMPKAIIRNIMCKNKYASKKARVEHALHGGGGRFTARSAIDG